MRRILGFVIVGFLLLYALQHGVDLPLFVSSTTKTELIAVPKRTEEKSDPKKDAQFSSASLVVRRLKASMNNPDSFELTQALEMKDGTLCLTYRARNGFNALVLNRAVVNSKVVATSDQEDFSFIWNKQCGGKSGDDITSIKYNLR